MAESVELRTERCKSDAIDAIDDGENDDDSFFSDGSGGDEPSSVESIC